MVCLKLPRHLHEPKTAQLLQPTEGIQIITTFFTLTIFSFTTCLTIKYMDLLKITYTDIYIRQTSHGHYMHGATREREREIERNNI